MLAFALPSALGVWAAPAMLRWLKGRSTPGASATTGAPVPVIWMRAEGAAAQGPAAMRAPVSVASPAAEAMPFSGGSTWRAPAWLDQQLAVRIAGLGLAAMAAWGLWHQLWAQWQAWCA